MDSKVCIDCGIDKPLDQFRGNGTSRHGKPTIRSYCIECDLIRGRDNYNRNYRRDAGPVARHERDPNGSKVCRRCKLEKSLLHFDRSANRKDGASNYCRDCTHELRDAKFALRVVDGVTLEFCRMCWDYHPLSEMRRGLKNTCKSCWATYMREWYEVSPGRARRRRFHLMPQDGLIAYTCNKCHVMRPVEEFYWNGVRHSARCRGCHIADNKAYIEANREKALAQRREHHYQKRYGLSYVDKVSMFEAQGGRCAICLRELANVKESHVDHCHADGRVRGILCRNCNRGIGELKDDADIMRRAIDYVTRLL